MERSVIFHGMEDKTGGFDSLQEIVNQWLMENKEVDIISRQTCLALDSSQRSMMVVTIFYREPAKK